MTRIVDPIKTENDAEDLTLRPKTLAEFIGQGHIKESLEIYLKSALIRKGIMEHILLSGPPGLGKTTMANIMANELEVKFLSATGSSINKAEDIIPILLSLERGQILFIDEIHDLNKNIEDILYPAMEDFKLTFTRVRGNKNGGSGSSSGGSYGGHSGLKKEKEVFTLKLQPFTLIGATTRPGMLATPFRDRFGILLRFDLYTVDELVEVIRRTSSLLGIPITPEGILCIANRSRGTPRIANRLVRRVRDVMIVKNEIEINKKLVETAFSIMRIDNLGLDDLDRKIIYNIYRFYKGGPVGIKTVAQSVGEEIRTIEEVYEPYLVHIGFLEKSSGGRKLTSLAIEHIQNDKYFDKIEIDKKIDKIRKEKEKDDFQKELPMVDAENMKSG